MIRRILPILMIGLLLAGCKQTENQQVQPEEIVPVSSQAPRYVQFQEPVRSTGILGTRLEVKMSFKTGGIVQTVNVRDGELVDKGTVLAALDLSEIRAHFRQADIALEKAERDFRRANNLYFDSVVTLETLQNARTALELARSQQDIAKFNMEHSRIVAPSKGRIQKVLVERNEIIAPGHPAILFASTGNDWVVRTSLSDKDIVKFDTGDSAQVSMDAFPGRQFPASVTEMGSFADPVTGTFEVELLLNEALPEFRTGFMARVTLFPSGFVHGYWLPMTAVHDLEDQGGTIFVLDSMRAKKRRIITGPLHDGGIIIAGGLDGSEMVITGGSAYLEDGQAVRIKNDV